MTRKQFKQLIAGGAGGATGAIMHPSGDKSLL